MRLTQDTPFLKEPGGIRVGSLNPGTRVVPGKASAGFLQITLQGWILTASTRPDARRGFDISARTGETIRAEPNGQVLGRVVTGALLTRVSVRGAWTEMRRSGWIPQSALAPAQTAARPPNSPDRPTARPPDRLTTSRPPDRADTGRIQLRKGATLQRAPDGAAIATLDGAADAGIAERNGEWVKVRVEAWVKRGDVEGPLAPPPAITAAMLRENPERYVGQTVEWRVQFLAHQQADELRPEMPLGARYLLARGPLPESGFVYVMVTREQAAQLQGLQALDELSVTATVRAARTRYLATPVVELVRLAQGR